MSTFYVGQKVVCLVSGWEYVNWWPRIVELLFGKKGTDPVKGGIYTITEVIGGFIVLAECRPDENYNSEHFRPLVSKSVALFRKIAADATRH